MLWLLSKTVDSIKLGGEDMACEDVRYFKEAECNKELLAEVTYQVL
jgi:hypothetical protein